MDPDEMIVDNDQGTPTDPGQGDNGAGQPAIPDTPPEDNPDLVLLDNDEQPVPKGDEGGAGSDDPGAAGTDEGEPSDDGGVPSDDTPAAPAVEEPDTPQVPKQPEPVADPGDEFVPKGEYGFDIELADGKTIRIEKPEDIENLPNDVDFGSPANLMKAQAKLNLMTTGIENERRDWESNKQAFEENKKTAEATEARINTIVNEMNYLETKGRLPKVDPQYENADWSDPEVQKQPGVKERLELLEYRAKENETRRKLGLSDMSLLEAATEMANSQATQTANEVKQREAAQRKARGAMVGGTNPTAPSNIPNDMIVGEGGSIRDYNPVG